MIDRHFSVPVKFATNSSTPAFLLIARPQCAIVPNHAYTILLTSEKSSAAWPRCSFGQKTRAESHQSITTSDSPSVLHAHSTQHPLFRPPPPYSASLQSPLPSPPISSSAIAVVVTSFASQSTLLAKFGD